MYFSRVKFYNRQRNADQVRRAKHVVGTKRYYVGRLVGVPLNSALFRTLEPEIPSGRKEGTLPAEHCYPGKRTIRVEHDGFFLGRGGARRSGELRRFGDGDGGEDAEREYEICLYVGEYVT